MPHSKYYDCPRCGQFMFYGPCDNPTCVATSKAELEAELKQIRETEEKYRLAHPEEEYDGPFFPHGGN